jgi:hypothetical protein|tara:strand:- start:8079 stop:9284 length:1206 start_codon:yes stop_codon:yes gene_type:complete
MKEWNETQKAEREYLIRESIKQIAKEVKALYISELQEERAGGIKPNVLTVMNGSRRRKAQALEAHFTNVTKTKEQMQQKIQKGEWESLGINASIFVSRQPSTGHELRRFESFLFIGYHAYDATQDDPSFMRGIGFHSEELSERLGNMLLASCQAKGHLAFLNTERQYVVIEKPWANDYDLRIQRQSWRGVELDTYNSLMNHSFDPNETVTDRIRRNATSEEKHRIRNGLNRWYQQNLLAQNGIRHLWDAQYAIEKYMEDTENHSENHAGYALDRFDLRDQVVEFVTINGEFGTKFYRTAQIELVETTASVYGKNLTNEQLAELSIYDAEYLNAPYSLAQMVEVPAYKLMYFIINMSESGDVYLTGDHEICTIVDKGNAERVARAMLPSREGGIVIANYVNS